MQLSEVQALIKETARQFARERLWPNAGTNDREHRFPAESLAEMAELGFMGMTVPEAWGGADTDNSARTARSRRGR